MEEVKKFLLVSIIPQELKEEDALKDLKELKSLVEAYGGVVTDLVVQHREVRDKGIYIGRGKIEEAARIVKEQKIDVVVLNAVVKSGQLFILKQSFYPHNPRIEVWDRVDLIVQIFSKHAHTAEAKLQIELAAMRHMGPRIYGMGEVLSRQGGGIGTRGIGETNTERMKRHWRGEVKKTQDKLTKLISERQKQLDRRRSLGLPTISIIGYTNAGKTSLFNKLTHKKKLAENQLFATLDSTVGRLYLPRIQKEVLVSDTIGFIRNLPAELIEAFKSTLLESINANVLLHVIDASDENMGRKIGVVEGILKDLEIFDKHKIYIFNKIDLVNQDKIAEIKLKYSDHNPHFVSIQEDLGIDTVIASLEDEFSP